MRPGKSKIVSRLRQGGYKVTPQRETVIDAIASTPDHLTPNDIYEKVRLEHPKIGFITIYRTLSLLTELGLICELHAGGSCRSYTVSAPGHHHHLICSGCGKVTDLSGYGFEQLEQRLSRRTGFVVKDHLIEFSGLCFACQKKGGGRG